MTSRVLRLAAPRYQLIAAARAARAACTAPQPAAVSWKQAVSQ